MRPLALLLILSCLLSIGCSSGPGHADAEDQSLPALFFPAPRYPDVYDASIEVLRSHGFEIERSDFRFGVITTKPKESPTAFEFWLDDATTAEQARSDTINAQQRVVSIRVTPFEDTVSGTDADADADAEAEAEEDTLPATPTYQLVVEVLVERLQKPDRYLTHSATGRLSASYGATPTHLRERGIDGAYALPMDRDTHMERRLTQAILDAVSE